MNFDLRPATLARTFVSRLKTISLRPALAQFLVFVLLIQTLAPPALAAPGIPPTLAFFFDEIPARLATLRESASREAGSSSEASVADAGAQSIVTTTSAGDFGIILTALDTPFNEHIGIDDHQPTRKVIVSANAPAGQPGNFELVGADGAHQNISNIVGWNGELRLATARDDGGQGLSLGGFKAGELFTATGVSGTVARVSPDGAAVQNPWVTLPGQNGADAGLPSGLYLDRTGEFAGDLVVVTTTGGVWRIKASGQATRVAELNTPLAGVTTIPNDATKYGPWAGRILVGAKEQGLIYAIDAQGASVSYALGVNPVDLRVIPAHENFYGVDSGEKKLLGAPADAFASMIGDVLVAQGAPGVLARVHWNGTQFEVSNIGQAAQWKQFTFSPAGIAPLPAIKQVYDKIAVVRHAPTINSGRVEGSLWQLLGENLSLGGTDTITADLFVPGTPTISTAGGPATFKGVIQGPDSPLPSDYTISLGGSASLRHIINRADPITLETVNAPPAPAGTRDVSLTKADESAGDFSTLRHLTLSGKAAPVVVPPGTYGRFSASSHTAFVFGVENSTEPAVYNFEELTLTGGSELRLAGPVIVTVKGNVTFTGSTVGAADNARRMLLKVAQGALNLSGGSVLYGIVRIPNGTVTVTGHSRLRGTVACDRLNVNGGGIIQITENDIPPPPVNRPPMVEAGPDQLITLPVDTVNLNGTVTDDGLPAGSTLTTRWSMASGPAPVSFGNIQNTTTTATFTEPGDYVLRLKAADGQLTASDTLAITVIPRNQPPVVDAGVDQTIELPNGISLNGSVTDDALPRGSTLTIAWNKVDGPGEVLFSNPNTPITSATFGAPGTYTLQLSANDTEFTVTDELVVTVYPENQPPLVDAGPDQTVRLPAGLNLNGAVIDDGWPFGSTLTIQWTQVSGPGTVTFAESDKAVSAATFSAPGVYVVRLSANDTRFTATDEASITVLPANEPPTVNAGADTAATLPSIPRDQTFSLRAISTGFNSPIGIDYHQPTNSVVMSVNYPSGQPYNFELVAADGARRGFSNISGLTDELKIASARDDNGNGTSLGGFRAGELFAGTGVPGAIVRISPDGATVQNPWVTLPGESGLLRGSLYVDRTGVFGGDLIAVSTTGGVWRINSAGQPTQLTRLGTHLEGVSTIPNDAAKYGPWAGKILIGAEEQGRLYTVDAQGTSAFYQLGINPEDIDIIPANENFYGVDFAGQTLWGAPASGFSKLVGDILIAQESPGILYSVRWNGSAFEKTPLAQVPQWEHVTFAPAGLKEVPTVGATVPLTGTVADDGLPAGVALSTTWTKVSGAGPVSFANANAPVTTATFTEPGTYVLRLTANDSEFTVLDEVTITINPPNYGPLVDAGADQTITLPAQANLNGSATDDGLPAGATLTTLWTKVSGPGTVAFNDTSAPVTTATFSVAGTYVLRLAASDTDLTSTDDVTITVKPQNLAPVVNAGPDKSVAFPASTTLNGTATDDGLPAGATLTSVWTKVSGPGTVTFANPNSPITSATFSVAGTYVLQLSANDTEHTTSDDVVVTVTPPVNQPPVVNAGPDQSIILPAAAVLNGTVTDDNLPVGRTLTIIWSRISGPGGVTFSTPFSTSTSVTFTAPGTYVLRLSASDGQYDASDTVTVTVFPPNKPPVVNAGADQIITLPNPASLSGTVTDDGFPVGAAVTSLWEKVSGPGEVIFATPNAKVTTATFGLEGTYVLRLTASDTQLTASDELVVVVMPRLVGHLTCTRSSKGTDFWLMFPGNYSGSPELKFFITGDVNTTGTVSIPGMNFSVNFNVTAGQITTVSVPSNAESQVVDGIENKGIHIVAQREVAVYALNRIQFTTDAYLALPTSILGTEYITLGYRNVNIVNGTQFGVVATANATTLTITPSVTTGSRAVGVPYNVTLNQGQTYQLRNTGASPNDLSGSIITSNKPVAVFGSHQCANIPQGAFYCDHIVEQLPPPETWGRNFVSMPLATRRNGDTFRFLASQDNTRIAVNGAIVATINKGKFHERILTGPSSITSDKPILVAQYSNGSTFDGTTSDPFMMLIPPYEQFGGNYTLATPATGFNINYINVVAPNEAVGNITLDGVTIPSSSFTVIGTSGFSGAQLSIAKGTHNLNAAFPFGAFVYGFAQDDSYGYPASVCLTSAVVGTKVSLTPKTKTNLIGTSDCVTASVTNLDNQPVGGIRVEFAVSGVNPTTGSAQTDATGKAQFCYTGVNAGADLIVASVTDISDTATKQWNPPNQAPTVNAGADQTITLPAPVALTGTVTDDGLPNGSPTVAWSKLSGPGTVNFANANAAATAATFSADGTYVLRLTASDTEFTSSDDVTITVNPVPPNQAPAVNAGADQTINQGANLLVNPSNEQTLVDGEIPGWTGAIGDAWAQAQVGSNNLPAANHGNTYFYAGETAASELRQDVNLAAFATTLASGAQEFAFKAYARTGSETPSDTARIMLEYRDATNNNVLGWLDSGDIQGDAGWVQLEDTRAAPAGTGWIRIRLIATRHGGTSNDAYFDDLSLRPVTNAGTLLAGTATDDGLPYGSTLSVTWSQVSGPGAATFANANAASTAATFPSAGTYVLRLTATDSDLTSTDEVTVTVVAPNTAPTVNAGVDQTIALPAAATLSGTVNDDGLPANSTLTSLWTKVSGPGTVTFAAPADAATTATFSVAGAYVLRLAASDSEYSAADEIIVRVNTEAVNQAPAVNAGANQVITLPGGATLSGTVTDDGLPANSTVTSAWSVVSGPSPVSFADVTQAATTATFGSAGVYVLRLTASDTLLTSRDEMSIIVNEPPGNHAPAVNAGADQTITHPADTVTLSGNAADDGLPTGSTLAVSWSKVSGPGTVSFANAGALVTAATFSLAGRYTLRLTATDSELTAFDDVIVTVVGENQAPVVNAGADQTITLPGTAALGGTVTDDGLPNGGTRAISWSKVSGPGTVSFANASAPATVATFSTDGLYVLRLSANDSALSALDEISITVNPRIQPPSVAINSPADGSTITARTPIVGTVSEGSSWRLEYSLSGGAGTPVWTAIAAGNTPVNNGLLATFDPTMLLNGTYAVRLVATDAAGQISIASFSATVEGEQKIGNFSISFNDLGVPVAGLPIQVTRTYDSRDKRSNDFGVGWSLGVSNVRLEKNGVIGQNWEETRTGGFLPDYCAQQTKSHIVSVTFPGGKVYKFQPVINPRCQRVYPLQYATVTFAPMAGTHGSLVAEGANDVYLAGSYPGPVDVLDLSTFSFYNPTVFHLTTEDGTVYVIDQATGVRSMSDTNGNTLNVSRNGLIHSSGKSITFTRDAQGRISRITDPAGAHMFYTYDARGDLVAYKDRENNETTFTYNSTHGLLSIKDPRGIQPVRNEYDDDGRIVKHIDAFGKEILYTHDPNSRQELITDRLGKVTVVEYDTRGNVIKTTDPLGNVTANTFDARGNKLSETNAAGKTVNYTYDANDNRTSITDTLGNTTHFTYNARKQPLTVTDSQGRVTTHTYDADGNILSTKDVLGVTTASTYNTAGQIETTTDGQGNTTRFEYNSAGNLTKQVDQLGQITTYAYDANGNPVTQTETRTNSAGISETLTNSYQYNKLSQLIKTTFPDGTTNESTYNSIGQKTADIDQLGRRTTYEYDEMARLIRTTYPDETKEETTYDAEGRRTKSVDRAGRATTYLYDGVGRPEKVTLSDGSSMTTAYDGLGRVTSTTDLRGSRTTYEYDPNCGCGNRLTKLTNSLGQSTIFTYDARGNQSSFTDARGNTTSFEYDALDRRIRTNYADGTSSAVTYDSLGRKVTQTDQAGKTAAFEYDKLNRLLKVVDALNQSTTFTYDEVGSVLTQTDANNHTTRYEYDKMGRRTKRTLPLGQADTYAYDTAGQLTSRTDFNGKTTTYAYDTMGRLLKKTPDASLAQPPVAYTYTGDGMRATMSDASGVTSYTYDALNRLKTKGTPQGTLSYTYDAAGNLLTTRSSNAGGLSVDYAYDALSRLTSVTDNRLGTSQTVYDYDQAGNLSGYTYANGVRTSYTYNSLNRLTEISSAKGTTLASYAYTLGAAGNRLSVTELSGRQATYTYDALYRLTGETVAGDPHGTNGAVGYTYDPVGNRKTRTSSLAGVDPATYDYDANDRLTTDTYDANGNTLTSGGKTYKFDFEDRITELNGGAVRVVYNGDGQRVSKTVSGLTTEYLVDENNLTGYAQVVEELRGGTVRRVYTYGHDLISQYQQLSGVWTASFYGYDGHGSVRYLTDADGAVTDTYDYDAFGLLIHRTGSTPNDYLYAGEQYDADLGLQYLRARYFNSNTGRFMSQDTYEGDGSDPISLHKYLYANADPVNTVDPTGHFGFSLGEMNISMGISATLHGMAGLARAGIIWWFKRALFGAIAGGAINGALGGIDAALGDGDILAGIMEGAKNGAIAGFIFAPLTAIRGAIPILTALGIGLSIESAQDSIRNGNYAQAVFRVASAAMLPWAVGKLRQLVGPLKLSRGNGGQPQLSGGRGGNGGSGSGGGNGGGNGGGSGGSGGGTGGTGGGGGGGPRLPQDMNVNPTPPPARPLNRPIGLSPTQNAAVQAEIASAQAAGGRDFRVNQQQVNANGQRVGTNRPDLQYTDANGRRVYVEYDTPSSGRGPGHQQRILANDPNGTVILRIVP